MIHRLLNALILLPDRFCYQTPADLGLRGEEVTFPNAQGVPLKGLFCCQGTEDAPSDGMSGASPVILFCPGTSGNLSAHLHYVELLCRAGFAVLGFDYTGFGQSAGTASLKTLVTDVLCAGEFLRHEKRIERFGLFGLSLGASVALLAAAVRPQPVCGVAVEGLALQKEVVRGILAEGYMGPRFIDTITYGDEPPIARNVHVLNTVRAPSRLADAFATLGLVSLPFQAKNPRQTALALAETPVLFIHGLEDPLLPFEGTFEVYKAKPGVKRLWLIPRVGHAQEPVLAQDAEYARQLGDFFYGVLPGAASSGRALPPLGCTVESRGTEGMSIRIANPGPPGLALVTIVGERSVHVRTMWAREQAEMDLSDWDPQAQVSCLRLFEVAGSGEGACIRQTLRGERYRAAFQDLIRALSQTLHEGRLADLEALLPCLPRQRPDPPFDFFLGLYCVQMMRRTRRKFPLIARAAAEAFRRYWHYGPSDGRQAVASPWRLVSEVLGKPVGQAP
jgi:pimeloyl-ACP methyl ester carboxylesterase